MREDRFDDKIRELLNKAHEDYDLSSWNKLSDRMDHESLQQELHNTNLTSKDESTTEDFIPGIKEKLSNQRATVNEEHWDSLKSDLDYIEARKDRLYIIKALEAAIVLLLLFTYFNYKWLSSDVEMDMDYIAEFQEQSAQVEVISASLNSERVDNSFRSTNSERDVKRTLSGPVRSLNSISFTNYILDKSLKNGFSKAEVLMVREGSTDHSTDLPTVYKKAIIPFIINRKKHSQPEYALLSVDPVENVNSDGWVLGLPISYDVNFINTDLNLGYLSNQIKSGLGGKSMGISIAYRKGNYELETGIKYGEKTFVPGLLTNYSKSGANSFLESQLDHMVIKQLQIPLLAKIYAAPYRKSTLYGMVGVAVNSILDNKYAIRRTVLPKARFANSPNSDVVNLKELPKGLVDGGSLSNNIYVSGVIGIGIQSYIIDDVSWYLQPQYQHSFTSNINQIVGKINSLSIEGGFKFSF